MTAKKEKPPYKWVIMIYACANDKNSEEGMTNFFKELNEVGKEIDKWGNKAEIKILLQAYRDWNPTVWKSYYAKRFEIKKNFLKKGRIPPDVVYTRLYTNMGDPNSLSDFIVWCKDNYEAEHYLLLLWGHGAQYGMFTGEISDPAMELKKPWRFNMFSGGKKVPYINQLRPVNKTIEKQYRDSQQVMIEFKTKNYNGLPGIDNIERKVINNGTAPIEPNEDVLPPTVIYYFDVDKNNRLDRLKQLIPYKPTGDSLTIEEICKSLWDTGHYIKNSGNIEIIMIFGCAMQTFELAYELSKCGSLGCKYLIASQELIYWEGYNYKESFLRLLENPHMNAKELSKHIIIDTKDKLPRKNSPNDGHKDKPAWAISCLDIQKSRIATKHLNNVSISILELSDVFAGKNKRKKRQLIWEFWGIFSFARLHCHPFGEAAFDDCYIDIIWFFENLKKMLGESRLLNGSLKKDSPLSRKYKKVMAELISLTRFLGKNSFVLKEFIGENRCSKAQWGKKILRTAMKGKKVNSSTGAHGVNIFFPISEYVKRRNRTNKMFFVSESDYKLEFELNKKKENHKSWHSLIEAYIAMNMTTRAQRVDRRGRFINTGENSEPDEW